MNIYGRRISNLQTGSLDSSEISTNSNSESSFPYIEWSEKIPGLNKDLNSERFFKSTQKSRPKKLAWFDTSNMDKDMGQTLLPRFISEDVTADSAVPLSGIGLMHYTNDAAYGGFIKPYFKTFNFNYLLRD